MPQRWVIWWAIEGDLRFLSHLDCVRAIERTAARGNVPLRFTQGFNPHPILSLALARPVGVAARDELLAITLESPVDEDELLRRMNCSAPRGMQFLRARALTGKGTPRACSVRYELGLAGGRIELVEARLAELAGMDAWPIERLRSDPTGKSEGRPRRRHGKKMSKRQIDLKPLVPEIHVGDSMLRWMGRPLGQLWARPGEVLRLLGLDERVDLADVVRTEIEYDFA